MAGSDSRHAEMFLDRHSGAESLFVDFRKRFYFVSLHGRHTAGVVRALEVLCFRIIDEHQHRFHVRAEKTRYSVLTKFNTNLHS